MTRVWNVPVNNHMTEIEEMPASQWETCKKCRKKLGAAVFIGEKRVLKKMLGVDANGNPTEHHGRSFVQYYYCSEKCLDAHGAILASGDFSF